LTTSFITFLGLMLAELLYHSTLAAVIGAKHQQMSPRPSHHVL